MDGGHRVAKAILRNLPSIRAVRFPTMPAPDRVEEVPRAAEVRRGPADPP